MARTGRGVVPLSRQEYGGTARLGERAKAVQQAMNVMEAAPPRGATVLDPPVDPSAERQRAVRGMQIVATLWFASWLLLGAAHTADLRAAVLGAFVFGWLGLPLVV